MASTHQLNEDTKMIEEQVIPNGFKKDPRGNLVAISNIKPIDIIRDDLVARLIELASIQQRTLLEFKNNMLNEIKTFVALSAEEYDVVLGGKKGNITMMNFDATRKINIQVSDCITFDERLQVAKSLIDECVRDWAQDANDRIRTLIEHAFQVDKQGQVSTAKILGLRKLDMNDSRWDQAMTLITDSIQITDSKEYVRFYQRRTSDDAWQAISLDLAAL